MHLGHRDRWKDKACRFWAAIALLSAAIGRTCAADEQPAADRFRQRVQPILEKYCYGCHGHGASEGGRKLDDFASDAALLGDVDLWHTALKNVRAGLMPPAGEDRPTADEARQLFDWIKFDAFGIDAANPDPGRITLRRLNRAEYRNTVRDLVGVDYNTGEQFPADDSGYGFDNIGDVLSMSPLLMEKYLAAAETIVARAIPAAAPVDEKGDNERRNRRRNERRIFTDGPPPNDADGRNYYARKILAQFARRALRRPVDEAFVDRLFAIARPPDGHVGESFEAGIARGLVAVLASPRFVFRVEAAADGNDGELYPLVDEYSLASRLSYFLWSTMPDDELMRLADLGELRKQLPQQVERMLKDGRSGALVSNFAGQWLRARDVEQVNIEPLSAMGLQDDFDRLERELRQLRGRGDRRGRRRANAENQQQPAANERGTAERGQRDEERQQRVAEIETELERLKKLRDSFDYKLRNAMRRETEMTFEYVLRNDRDVVELVDGNYTFLNETLARHYGIEGVEGDEMRRVELPEDSPRGGLLTQGTILAVTSNPTRTSPVKRGQYILENILGTPAPPPPAPVPTLEQSVESIKDHEATFREAMELHRREPLCMACHARMDPLGLALENFNALGMWRAGPKERPIDPSGQLLTGERFDNIGELKKIIADSHRLDFYRCLAEKLLTYALGRGLDYHDEHTVDVIVERMAANGGRLSALILGIVDSAPFQKVRRQREDSKTSNGR
ncbi:MAG: DUF1592 domain-containing protein [Pirellulales bacterium]